MINFQLKNEECQNESLPEAPKPEKKKFKQKRMMEYENKLRLHSNPDKVFRYFATVQAVTDDDRANEVYMTPNDLIRSLTPGGDLQPSNLQLDQYKKIKTERKALRMNKKELSKIEATFQNLGGYINFEDYMFILMMLTTPRRNFEIAFRMFDLDGNGVVDSSEFEKVTETIMKGNTVVKRHRKKRQSNISAYFFGEDKSRSLSSEDFTKFQEELQKDILKMEYNLLERGDNDIAKMKDFGMMLIEHARMDPDKTKKIRKRLNKFYKKKKVKTVNEETGEEEVQFEQKEDPGIHFEEVHNFFNFIKSIHEIEIAFTFFAMAGKEVDEEMMTSIAKTVCGVDLKPELVEMIFLIFDEDGNGTLSHKEFIDVMKKRLIRGLDSKRELGVWNKFSALTVCGYEAFAPESVKVFAETVKSGMSQDGNASSFGD
ncbi:unnamed protein product [Oikopleura dioica]|uniref:Calcium uptake protein 1, mitochondrial n=1 Tax=Oikopleura dioica TaxID=34765 RepID=E4XF24_OIKDI|nr:unnamed protein product [Oikopleura dioica]